MTTWICRHMQGPITYAKTLSWWANETNTLREASISILFFIGHFLECYAVWWTIFSQIRFFWGWFTLNKSFSLKSCKANVSNQLLSLQCRELLNQTPLSVSMSMLFAVTRLSKQSLRQKERFENHQTVFSYKVVVTVSQPLTLHGCKLQYNSTNGGGLSDLIMDN